MRTNHDNPYTAGTSDHVLWERYQQSYRSQPLSSQLFDLETRFRAVGHALLQLNAGEQPPRVHQQLHDALVILESALEDLEDAAERAAARESGSS